MRIPALLVTFKPCSDGQTPAGRTFIPGSIPSSTVNALSDGEVSMVIPGEADSSASRVRRNYTIKVISLAMQGADFSSLTTAIDALNP